MKTLLWNKASVEERTRALQRPTLTTKVGLANSVETIVNDVKARGDAALSDFSLKYDGIKRGVFPVSQREIEDAFESTPPKLRKALRTAKANIEKFHRAEMPNSFAIEVMPGVKCGLVWRGIDRVGLYVPAGTAPLFSAVLMQAIPARLAECKTIILCSPPQRDTGTIHPAVLAAAKICGIRDVFAVGGAQAIAAMAFGTDSVPKVDKIFGPGNAYVTLAKQLVSNDPAGAAADMPAGPSEVMVIAERDARPEWVAADLLAQAEHGTTSQAMLLTTSAAFAKRVDQEVNKQLASLPRRDIAAKAIEQGAIIVVPNMNKALEIANAYAPEHLIMHSDDAAKHLPKIRNAGSVFLGGMTPESAGDYASGTNHVLPTYGYARAYGGLSIYSFMKTMTVQSLSPVGMKALGPAIITMAEAEGLQGHANAVRVRIREGR